MKRERGRRTRRKVCSFCVDKVEEIDIRTLLSCAVILLNAAKFCPVVFPVTVLNINAK